MVWFSIQYPLPLMTILDKESEEITKKLYAQLIPSGSANHHFPGFFQHAPNVFLVLLFLGVLIHSSSVK
jgi:hypothetical protein